MGELSARNTTVCNEYITQDLAAQKIENIQVLSFEEDGKKKTMGICHIWILFLCICYALIQGFGNQARKTDLRIQQISDSIDMNDLIYYASDKSNCYCQSKKVLITSSQPTTKGQILSFEVLFYVFASFGIANWLCLLFG